MNRVQDKVALITGGASGLGLASGKLLLEEGARVIFTDKDSKSLNQIPELIDAKYNDFYSLKELDVTSEKNWQNVLNTTMDEYKGINVLLNSAGISIGADIASTSFEIWKKVHEVNLDGVFNLTSPDFTTHEEFFKAIIFHKKGLLKWVLFLPKIAVSLLLGDMSEMLLYGPKTKPERTLKSGYKFKFQSLNKAFSNLS